MEIEKSDKLFSVIRETILKARNLAYKSSNAILLNTYWEIGRLIVEDEQKGQTKAEYGKATLKNLSKQLTLEFGAGFDERNLNNMRGILSFVSNLERSAFRIELDTLSNH